MAAIWRYLRAAMDAPRVALRSMTTTEFKRYLRLAVPEYARGHVRAGDFDPKKALAKAKAEYAELLPKGVATPGHYLYTIALAENDKAIGMLWFDFRFRLDKAQRGKGLGREALGMLEQQAKILGAVSVGLHVFGDNAAARALYEKCGFRYSSMHMTKDLY
ncbi:MAG: GNAT family N-acetyltransferase [Betaproteobacteria bacterium]|nr:MAG: GNAT family N-acetyltransferase [Betaproteobacteria bacterium]